MVSKWTVPILRRFAIQQSRIQWGASAFRRYAPCQAGGRSQRHRGDHHAAMRSQWTMVEAKRVIPLVASRSG